MSGGNKTVLLDEKAWSSSGNLFFPAFDGSPDGLRKRAAVTLQADFAKAGYYTLQFGVSPFRLPNGLDLSGDIVPQAEILWSVKGNYVRRFINVYNGTTISGPGEGVLVRVRDASPPSSFVTEPTKYTLSINLVPGTRPNMANGMPPIFTPRERLTSLIDPSLSLPPPYALPAGSDLLTIPIPSDCGITSVMILAARQTDEAGIQPLDITNSQLLIQQENTSHQLGWLNYDSCYKFVPLAPGTTRLVLSNSTDEIDPGDIRLLWITPIFGVDG